MVALRFSNRNTLLYLHSVELIHMKAKKREEEERGGGRSRRGGRQQSQKYKNGALMSNN